MLTSKSRFGRMTREHHDQIIIRSKTLLSVYKRRGEWFYLKCINAVFLLHNTYLCWKYSLRATGYRPLRPHSDRIQHYGKNIGLSIYLCGGTVVCFGCCRWIHGIKLWWSTCCVLVLYQASKSQSDSQFMLQNSDIKNFNLVCVWWFERESYTQIRFSINRHTPSSPPHTATTLQHQIPSECTLSHPNILKIMFKIIVLNLTCVSLDWMWFMEPFLSKMKTNIILFLTVLI